MISAQASNGGAKQASNGSGVQASNGGGAQAGNGGAKQASNGSGVWQKPQKREHFRSLERQAGGTWWRRGCPDVEEVCVDFADDFADVVSFGLGLSCSRGVGFRVAGFRGFYSR